MIWILIGVAAYLGVGAWWGVKWSRKWYKDAYMTKLRHDEKCSARGVYHHCYSSCPMRPLPGEAAWRAVGMMFIWLPREVVIRVGNLFNKLGKLTYESLEDDVKQTLSTEKQLKKMQYVEKYRKELDQLAFDRRMASSPREMEWHNNQVDHQLRMMTINSDCPLGADEVRVLQDTYKIPLTEMTKAREIAA